MNFNNHSQFKRQGKSFSPKVLQDRIKIKQINQYQQQPKAIYIVDAMGKQQTNSIIEDKEPENSAQKKERKQQTKIKYPRTPEENGTTGNNPMWRCALKGVEKLSSLVSHFREIREFQGARLRLNQLDSQKVVVNLEKQCRPGVIVGVIPSSLVLGTFTDGSGDSDSENYFKASMEFDLVDYLNRKQKQAADKAQKNHDDTMNEIKRVNQHALSEMKKAYDDQMSAMMEQLGKFREAKEKDTHAKAKPKAQTLRVRESQKIQQQKTARQVQNVYGYLQQRPQTKQGRNEQSSQNKKMQ